MRIFILLLAMFASFSVYANDVAIVKVVFNQSGNYWRVDTTLKHNDTGWEHYADAWRVVNEKGEKLGERILFHPHENEQPFTRSLRNLSIPSGTTVVYVEAHDKVHGWSKDRVKIDLNATKGDRYQIVR